MSNHQDSCGGSRALCDKLFEVLSKTIDGLQRTQVKTWCCYCGPSRRKRFAYVTHRVRARRIEVWFLGNTGAAPNYPGLDIRPRAPTEGTYGTNYQARFSVEDESQIAAAADLLTARPNASARTCR